VAEVTMKNTSTLAAIACGGPSLEARRFSKRSPFEEVPYRGALAVLADGDPVATGWTVDGA
jgi:hypothetical protein